MSFAKIRPRRGTATQWTNANPILVEGEIGIEVPTEGVGTGTVNIKFGDGVTPWNDLPYGIESVALNNLVGNTDISDIGDGTITGGLDTLNSNLVGKRTITFANYYKAFSVPTEKALMGTVMVANKECAVTVSVTQVFANVRPKLTCLQVVNANGVRQYNVATGTDCATILVHMNNGDYIELYASAETAGTNNFSGYMQIVEL